MHKTSYVRNYTILVIETLLGIELELPHDTYGWKNPLVISFGHKIGILENLFRHLLGHFNFSYDKRIPLKQR